MLEQPGNIPNVGYNANGGVEPACNGAPNPANKSAVPGNIADDDAAAAIIKNPLLAETADIQQGASNGDIGVTDLIKENLVKLRELAKKLQATLGQTKESIADIKVSGVLGSLQGEISAIIAFDGFLIGVHEKINEFTKFVQFSLDQIMDVEQNMAEFNEKKATELGKFVLSRTMKETLKAMRCQENLDPDRVLHLLKDET